MQELLNFQSTTPCIFLCHFSFNSNKFCSENCSLYN